MSDLVESLRAIERLKVGEPFPESMLSETNNWGAALSAIAGAAANEIERLRLATIYPRRRSEMQPPKTDIDENIDRLKDAASAAATAASDDQAHLRLFLAALNLLGGFLKDIRTIAENVESE